MYLVYPEGNWIEVDTRTPYLSIGATAYGKPVLDRTLTFDTDIATVLKVAYLSFDSTRVSSADVGFPVDMLTFLVRDGLWREVNYDYDDLREQRIWWNEHIKELVAAMPDGPWMEPLVPEPRASVDVPKPKRLTIIKDD
jgi:putative proteasome-type protease